MTEPSRLTEFQQSFSAVPFAMGSVVGIRAWTLEPSAYTPDRRHVLSGQWLREWPSSEVTARCFAKNSYASKCDGPVPNKDCSCGIYAFTKIDELEYEYFLSTYHIIGIVEGYGRVLIGEKGFRAEKARILALSYQFSYIQDKLSITYPDVPFYTNHEVMLRDFPLTAPETQ